ncbi:hypothetical protein ACWEAF_32220 [Streptomyces sp. NPDC005071]|uniref:hypothetical protein n=1 Tax=Streptomyces sp. NPDC057291 TaxID=3346087 RepID=UPI00362FEC2C
MSCQKLRALPGIGTVRADDLRKRLDIAETRRLRGLGPRQRAGLVEGPHQQPTWSHPHARQESP